MKLNKSLMDDNISLDQASEEVVELAAIYAENYVDYAENLPFDLQHDVTRLREIDCSCREFLLEIENLYSSFTKEKDLNLKKRGILLQIQRLLARCQELGDEKISIVQQINEAIENKRKQVDHSCYRFKSAYRPDLEFGSKRDGQRSDNKGAKRSRRHRVTQHYGEKHEKVIRMESSPSEYRTSSFNGASWKQSLHSSIDSGSQISETSSKQVSDDFGFVKKSERLDKKESSTPPPLSSFSSTSHSNSSYGQTVAKSVSTLKTSTTSVKPIATSAITSVSSSNGSNRSSLKGKKKKKKVNKHNSERGSARSPSPQPELPIDPDEPTYCLCDQVSFGQMIGCDNKKCPIEWFHFSCVGLSHKPKGKWYCPDCLRDIKDRRKDNKRDHR